MKLKTTSIHRNHPIIRFVSDEKNCITGMVCVPVMPECETINWTIELPDELCDPNIPAF